MKFVVVARRSVQVALAIGSVSIATACAMQPSQPKEPERMKVLERPRIPNVPPAVPTAIDSDLQKRAAAEIAAAFNSSDPVTRAQALEATSKSSDPAALDRVQRGLADKEWLVRFAAAMCAGDLKLHGAYNLLLAATADKEPSVRVAVRYALHRLGDTTYSKDLEPLSQNPDPRVRGNVAYVIGLLKEPTGTRVVRPLLADHDAAVRMQAAEALWRLGDDQGLNNLVAGMVSKFPDEQIVCIQALAAPRDQRVKDYVLGKLTIERDNHQYPEIQLTAARALGVLGSDEGVAVALQNAASNDPRLRVLAAFALGDIGRTDSQATLGKLLADPSADVQLAAAVAVKQIGMKAKA